ncbi:uncharacterized protein LOC126738346 [Anthonomus grandis grandis]|uniref:uncharacterized protein LOC126738346 n=1 Tax=Anthonomus grandis grandis TaxID=2921223 RepID=UPI002165C5F4|nr:uncharacterized protein LOC126738346 [Anthonomus grandis grandis]
MSVAELTKIVSPAFTETVLLDIIGRKHPLKDLQILEIEIDNAGTKKGDSYLSTISRFKITASGVNDGGKTEKVMIPVIVKFFPKNVPRQKTFRSAEFFKTEIQFYSLVWPEMQKTKLEKHQDEPDIVPLYLAGYVDGQNDFIALEDLSYDHFKSSGRNDDITREKLSVFLKTLAHFHALGIATKLRNPDFENIASSALEETYFAERLRSWYENFMYQSMRPKYIQAAKALLPSKYEKKISDLFSKDLFGEAIKCCIARNKLTSVTEGDSWLPNFMFKEENGQLRAMLIDFQLARYGPITNDLLHFLISGGPEQLLENHWDELIAEYHQYLSEKIEQLTGKKDYITLEEIHDQIRKYPYVGVVMALESTLMSLLKDNEVADLDFLEGNDAYPLEVVWKLPDFDQPRIQRLAFLVKLFVEKGLI